MLLDYLALGEWQWRVQYQRQSAVPSAFQEPFCHWVCPCFDPRVSSFSHSIERDRHNLKLSFDLPFLF